MDRMRPLRDRCLSHTVTQHPETVGDGCVSISTNQRVWMDESDSFISIVLGDDQFGEIFEVDLLTDTDTRRND